jgi:cell division protein FtsB
LWIAIAMTAMFGWAALSGPQGLQGLLEKRQTIRDLQEENAALTAENIRRKERIQRLEDNPNDQEIEIRKQLKLQKPGETIFKLPESKPADAPSRDSAAQDGAAKHSKTHTKKH